MILGFITHFPNGKPTYFLEKIEECTTWETTGIINTFFSVQKLHIVLTSDEFHDLVSEDHVCPPKIHTLRKDKENYWRKGRKIDFCIYQGTSKETCFGHSKCTGTQRVVLVPKAKQITLIDSSEKFGMRQITDIEQFAKNDGFDSEADFWEYFDKPEAYTVIHWTDFKY